MAPTYKVPRTFGRICCHLKSFFADYIPPPSLRSSVLWSASKPWDALSHRFAREHQKCTIFLHADLLLIFAHKTPQAPRCAYRSLGRLKVQYKICTRGLLNCISRARGGSVMRNLVYNVFVCVVLCEKAIKQHIAVCSKWHFHDAGARKVNDKVRPTSQTCVWLCTVVEGC